VEEDVHACEATLARQTTHMVALGSWAGLHWIEFFVSAHRRRWDCTRVGWVLGAGLVPTDVRGTIGWLSE
jgi:hypothetical protein